MCVREPVNKLFNLLRFVLDDDFLTNVAVLLTGLLTGFGFALPAFGLSTGLTVGGSADFFTIFGLTRITAFSDASLI